MKVLDVTLVYNDVNGFAGICSPIKDNNGRWILSKASLSDKLLEPIKSILLTCPEINHAPKVINVPNN